MALYRVCLGNTFSADSAEEAIEQAIYLFRQHRQQLMEFDVAELGGHHPTAYQRIKIPVPPLKGINECEDKSCDTIESFVMDTKLT